MDFNRFSFHLCSETICDFNYLCLSVSVSLSLCLCLSLYIYIHAHKHTHINIYIINALHTQHKIMETFLLQLETNWRRSLLLLLNTVLEDFANTIKYKASKRYTWYQRRDKIIFRWSDYWSRKTNHWNNLKLIRESRKMAGSEHKQEPHTDHALVVSLTLVSA